MNTIPLTFSAVTGATLATLGALLASSGLADWGLFAVGLGIVGVALLSWASQGAYRLAPVRPAARGATRNHRAVR